MRENVVALPIILGAVLMTIVAVTNPEPHHIGDANKMVQAEHITDAGKMVEERFTYAIPRFAVDLEGDLSPVGDGSTNRTHDFPAWEEKPTPTPEPTPAPQVVATAETVRTPLPAISSVGPYLSEAQMRDILVGTWPAELHGQALAVACGIGNARWPSGESTCNPRAIGDQGRSYGLFQLNVATWAPYCGVSAETLLDPWGNAACAYQVYLYDIGRGHAPWQQWTVKPW